MKLSNDNIKLPKQENIHNLIHQLKSKSQSKTPRTTFFNVKQMEINANNLCGIIQKTENNIQKINKINPNMKFTDFSKNFNIKNIRKKEKNPHILTSFKSYESNLKNNSPIKSNFKSSNLIKNQVISFDSPEKNDEKLNYSTIQYQKRKNFDTIKHSKRNILIKNYKLKHSMDITRPKYLPKLNDPNTLIPCFNFLNNNKKVLNLALNDFNGKNILFSPLKTLNYDDEIKNLGTRFITPDKYYNDNNNNNRYPYFIEKITSYKILRKFRIVFNSFSDKSKYEKYVKTFDSLTSINKI